MEIFSVSNDIGKNNLINIFTLDFDYNDNEYHCIIRVRSCDHMLLYFVTLLNAEMDEIFPEQYILVEKGNKLNIDTLREENENAQIKLASGIALRSYLELQQSDKVIKDRFIA